MASENSTHVDAAPRQVFAVLLDAWSYADWVVGAKDIRDVDPHWPAPGSRFHHTVGVGPVSTDDCTEIEHVDAPRRLVLKASARPFGVARIVFDVMAEEGGSRVTIEEEPVEGPATGAGAAADAALSLRNTESLRRLRDLVEERAATG
ncbi:MAG TPA: SRPBCC family protein [Acidimicrobiales bacterium]|nr:SRPBCC family protein [Acidimicrobiales bacterium]